jgi:excisionase family DNA binding protein
MRVHELADLMGVSRNTVLRAIEREEIRATKLGRAWFIPASEVARLTGDER